LVFGGGASRLVLRAKAPRSARSDREYCPLGFAQGHHERRS